MTALSGEEAVRLTMTRKYHLITMDETLSSSYCTTIKEQQENALADTSQNLVPDYEAKLHIDADRHGTATRRNLFFENEMFNHKVLDGDGSMAGHVAMRQILDSLAANDGAEAPVIFNLTGNVMDVDRQLYIKSGSSGVLPKPTKLDDLVVLLQRQLGELLYKGMCKMSEDGFITTIDESFTYGRARGGIDGFTWDTSSSASSSSTLPS
jgi:CheY-like chemotaxis protein